MSDLENRIEKLEKHTGDDEPRVTIVYVRDAKSEAEADAAIKRGDTVIEYVSVNKQIAIDEYKAKHPDWEPSSKDMYIQVRNKHTKELTEHIIAGELLG